MRTVLIALAAVATLATPALAQTAPTAAYATPVSAEAFAAATERMRQTAEAIDQVPGATPAMALVMVRRGQAPVVLVRGPLDVNRATQANADTPFYIASQTKAFVGLLALKLDEQGIFALDQTLSDVWPELTLPEGADPHVVTFRQLLSHQGPFENETLSFRTAYSDLVPASDYPRLLAEYSTAREPGFAYSNLGYLVYAAALETRTGHDWRSWLQSDLFGPAGITRITPFISRFPADELPSYHQWLGGDDWLVRAGKTDDVMQAAGGLVASPNDMARWLQMQLGEIPDVVSPAVLAESHRTQVEANIDSDLIPCQGYAVGWNVCHIGAVDVLAHGGGYTAVRSSMAVSPELGIGFAFMSNSDSLTGALSQILLQAFFEAAQGSDGGMSPEQIQAQLTARLPRLVEGRRREVAERRAEAQWEGWAWHPSASDLRRYLGRYRNARLGDFEVTLEHGVLSGHLGAFGAVLEPAKTDLFGFVDGPLDPPAPFLFERRGRRVTAFTWDGDRFERVD